MQSTVLSLPFSYRQNHILPRHKNESNVTIPASLEIAIPHLDDVPVENLIDIGGYAVLSVGGELMRPLVGPDGGSVSPERLIELLADPDSDLESWRDCPSHEAASPSLRETDASRHRTNQSPKTIRDYTITYGRDPRKAWGEPNLKRLGSNDYDKRRLEFLDRYSRMAIINGHLLIPCAMPVIRFIQDKYPSKNVTALVQSAEDYAIACALSSRQSKFSSEGKIDSDVLVVPADHATLAWNVVEKYMPTIQGTDEIERVLALDRGTASGKLYGQLEEAAKGVARHVGYMSLNDIGSADGILVAARAYGAVQTLKGDPSPDNLSYVLQEVRVSLPLKPADELTACAFIEMLQRTQEYEAALALENDAIDLLTTGMLP